MEDRKSFLLEGLLPMDVWNFICVALILFGVFVAVFKGVVMIRDEMRKTKDKKKINTADVTEEIAEKVMSKLKPEIDKKFADFNKNIEDQFKDIDRKLENDKATLTLHTTQLNDHESRVGRLEGGNRALCHGMLALLERDPALTNAQHAMQKYLIDGRYNEDDWNN